MGGKMELFDCFEKDNRPIYIYGYGNMGRNAYIKLRQAYSDRVKGILVSELGKKTKTSDKPIVLSEYQIIKK